MEHDGEIQQNDADVMFALKSGKFPDWVTEETKAEIVDPATKEKLQIPMQNMENTNGLKTYFLNKNNPKRRESYLCMLYQKEKCKSFARCNQIHACRDFVKNKRTNHGAAESEEPYTDQRSLEVIVTDPSNPSSKVIIPHIKTIDSPGRAAYHAQQSSFSNNFQICPGLLAARNCCVPEGPSQCPHIHVQSDFLQFLKRPRPCCPTHSEQSGVGFRGRVFMVNRLGQRCALPVDRILETRGLKELTPSNSTLLVFNANRACRMFLEGKCPFESQCHNLHICREFYAFFVNAPNPSLITLQNPTMPGAPGHFRPEEAATTQVTAAPPVVQQDFQTAPTTAAPTLGVMNAMRIETYGIPLVTEEGPVPIDVLPAQARCKPAMYYQPALNLRDLAAQPQQRPEAPTDNLALRKPDPALW
eukprot:TRINITY_DN4926_c0_g1_i1.p1 TRINITY_DN4926_c0_g1~~TRINITY_DN4926_c0_g1_i1.p1  ORF type:complete len:416 (+),score=74.06 TRINITY_DN4926_c0_g1_i1:54-1301(+)